MTEELERVRRSDTQVEVRSFRSGPRHLEYHAYEAFATPKLLHMVRAAERKGLDACVIGCFYDTGLRAKLQKELGVRSWTPSWRHSNTLSSWRTSHSLAGTPTKIGGYAAPPQDELVAFGLDADPLMVADLSRR